MEARESTSSFDHKATIKTEVQDESSCNSELVKENDDPFTSTILKDTSTNDPRPFRDVCKKESEEVTFKISLPRCTRELDDQRDIEREDKENESRRKIRVDSRQPRCGRVDKKTDEGKIFVLQQASRLQIRPEGFPAFLCIDGRIADPAGIKRKIPRPANAFMLFANEWRKKLAAENPRESNKDISVRLGILWKNMGKDVKEKYFALAREVDAEHKRKYPGMLCAYSTSRNRYDPVFALLPDLVEVY